MKGICKQKRRIFSGSVAQFVGDFNRILGLVKVFDEVCGKSLVFDRRGARAKARRLAPRLV
jgi:hypothetical protein